MLVTHSSLNAFQACRKSYEYRYVRGIVPIETSTALGFGTAIHRGLEALFLAIGSKVPQNEAVEAAVTACTIEASAQNLEIADIVKCEVLMRKYAALYYSGDEQDFSDINVEQEFRVPFLSYINGVRVEYAGKVDGIVRRQDGKLYIVEHKTASRVDDGYIDRIRIDSQIRLYAQVIAHIYREEVAGAIYDIIIKPGIKWNDGETDEEFAARQAAAKCPSRCKRKMPDTQETFRERLDEAITDENFRREIIEFDAQDLSDTWDEMKALACEIADGVRYYKNTGNCLKYGVCPYMPICLRNGNADGLEGFEIRRLHEELSEELTEEV